MAELKNIRIAISGIYDYAKEELPSLRLSLADAPEWVEDKNVYKVYRPASVLAAACDKFKLLPLTHHHPMTPVDGANFRELAIGYTGENPFIDYLENKNEVGIRSNVLLYDDEALDAYERGEKQLSPGYIANFEWKRGTAPSGEPYDIIMKEITDVNHLAILPAGRGGADAVVMDGALTGREKTIFDYVRNGCDLEDGAPFGNDNASKEHKKEDEENADKDLGHDYSEYKGLGQSAVNHLLETKEGQVKGAFNRYDLGDIDVVWGKVTDPVKHKGYGLAHILDKHGTKAVEMIEEIIKNGTVQNLKNEKSKIVIKYKKYNVILSKRWHGEERKILISGFDKSEGKNATFDSVNHYMVEGNPLCQSTPTPGFTGSHYMNNGQLTKTSSDNIAQKTNDFNQKTIFDRVNGTIFDLFN